MVLTKALSISRRLVQPILANHSVLLYAKRMDASHAADGPIRKLPRIKPPGPLKVWDVIEKVYKDGKRQKFTIQEIPEDRYEDAIDHMCKYFLASEPTCKSLNAVSQPDFVAESRDVWRMILDQGIAVAAFVDNSNGGKPVIAGMNVLGVERKEEQKTAADLQLSSQLRLVFEAVIDVSKEAGVYEHYGVDKYMFALGLSVAPAFQGCNLGADILNVRVKVGREYGIPVTSTAFTSPISYKSAVRAGFELLLEKNFADIKDKNGKLYFPDIDSKTIRIMGKRL